MILLLAVLLVMAGSVGLTLDPAELHAQTVPFGKNKIQYTDFQWNVLSGEHLDVYYYPEEEELARVALEYGEASYRVLAQRFRHNPFRRIPLVVYSSHQHFEQTNVTPGFIPEGVLGFTEFLKRRVAMPFRGSYAEFRHTLRHELVHVFHLSKLSEVYALHGDLRSALMPHWWGEGLAEFWSSPQDADDRMVISDVVLSGRLPTLRQFTYSASFLSYPLGGELFHYLSARFGEGRIADLYDEIWRYDSFEAAFEGVFGVGLDALDAEWRYELQREYFPTYADRPPLNVAARALAGETGPNFKPVVGRIPGDTASQLFYLSPRTGYTNIYRTRLSPRSSDPDSPVTEAVVQGERSAEFESFHPFESGIGVSNGVLAFVSKFQERDALFLWDIERDRVVGRYQWTDLVGVRSPSWSPEGRRIVFTGLSVSGYSDLYVYDFDTQERRALTADRYEDLDPDWSPDGREIVFASDRTAGGRHGATNLYLVDVAGGTPRPVTQGNWRDLTPRWSRGGDRIAFTSDRTGLYELYTIDREGEGERVTAFSGAAFDPEWLADDSGLVFSGFIGGTFLLYVHDLEGRESTGDRIALEGSVTEGAFGPASAAVTPAAALPGRSNGEPRAVVESGPPGEADPEAARRSAREVRVDAGRPEGSSPAGEAASQTGAVPVASSPSDNGSWDWEELASESGVEGEPRRYSEWGAFSLDFAGGDALIAPGVGSAQGLQFLGSDMLGNHMMFLSLTAVQNRSFRDIADAFSGQLMYLNLSHRLNYGGGIFRFNGLFRDVSYNVYEEDSYGSFFLASYPFSKYRRLEFQMSLEQSDRLDREDFLRRDTRDDPRDLTRDALLTRNFLSYVKDNTLWLPYGPIDGTRYNLTAGLVTDLSRGRPESWILTVDARRYLRTSLLTAVALRAFGYYSGGAIPGRQVLGGPHHLRGYPRLSLAGSRVWLLNTEWRFPILHSLIFRLPFGDLRFPGVQGALFTDIGSSWLEDQDKAEGTWGSYGSAFRMSLGAPLILRLDVGKRFRIGDLPPLFFQEGQDFDDWFVEFFIGFNY